MCRWLTYCGEPIYLDRDDFETENSLIHQSLNARHSHVTTNGDGFGIGWYAERPVPGTYRDILPAWNDANLRSIAHQIRSGLFLAHVRASTGTATSRANCHPFAHGKWLFMHNGQIGGYDRIRRKIEALVDDAYYVHRLRTTDSELIFYLMLSMGLDRDPTGAQRRRRLPRRGRSDEAGRYRGAATLHLGLHQRRRNLCHPLSPPMRPRLRSIGVLRNDQLLVVSEPLDDDQRCWHEVAGGPDRLVTERNIRVDMVPFLQA